MQKFVILLLFLAMLSCSENSELESSGITSINKNDQITSETSLQSIILNKTSDNSKIKFPEKALVGTDAEKEFLATGKNIYVGDAEAIKTGKKRYNLWSCTQCHGPTAKGQVGPGLTGPKYNYAKDATNKGMFETIWGGTNGGMGAKGFGLMAPDDGVTVDELLKIIAFVRSNGKGLTGNE